MDLSREVVYRGFTLNSTDADLIAAIVPGNGIGDGITGCVLDSADLSDVDVVQFTEKKSLEDGMDAGDVYLGARRVRIAGTLYATTRALLFDLKQELKAALSPTLAFREEPADKGYRPFYFSRPTNRIEDYPAGAIDLRVLAMPRALNIVEQRDHQGGDDSDALAIPFQATFVCRDPRIMSDVPVDVSIAESTRVNVLGVASTNVLTAAGHGLSNGHRVYFVVLNGGAGLAVSTAYYVRDVTTDTFKLAATSGGAAIDFTTDITSGSQYVKLRTDSGDFTSRGDYHSPLNMLVVVGATAGTITVSAGDSNFVITVPASTGDRIVRYKGDDKVLTFEENDVEEVAMGYLSFQNQTTHPQIPGGVSPYSVTFSGVVVKDTSHMWFWESYA